eukprot:scaffold120003_cov23-Prasinocladus_malaysianus.AAC.1
MALRPSVCVLGMDGQQADRFSRSFVARTIASQAPVRYAAPGAVHQHSGINDVIAGDAFYDDDDDFL